MKILIKFLAIYLLCFSVSAENQRETLVLEYLEVTGTKTYFKNFEASFTETMKKYLTIEEKILASFGEGRSPEIEEIQDKYTKKLSHMAAKYFSWESMKAELVPIFLESYTDRELLEINSFFSSYYGKKFLEKSGHMEGKLSEIVERKVDLWQPEMSVLVSNMKSEISAISNNSLNQQ